MQYWRDIASFIAHVRRRATSYGKRAIYEARSAVGHSNFVPFIVLTRSRSGSNLLISFLNAHPNVYVEGEIFGRMRGRDPIWRLKKAFGKQPRPVRAKGFKIFYYHPLDCSAEGLWKELEAMKAVRVVHLKRENVLRTLLSRKVAGVQNVWTMTSKDANHASPTPKVTFTAAELESGFVQTKEWEDAAARRFQNHPMLVVTYEDLVADARTTLRKVLTFLGLEYVDPHTNLRKQNPGSLPELIENYPELRNAFMNTPWLKHFEERRDADRRIGSEGEPATRRVDA